MVFWSSFATLADIGTVLASLRTREGTPQSLESVALRTQRTAEEAERACILRKDSEILRQNALISGSSNQECSNPVETDVR